MKLLVQEIMVTEYELTDDDKIEMLKKNEITPDDVVGEKLGKVLKRQIVGANLSE